ncbi:hypothetical protein NOR_08072 [Metarhizium rileyi]|uniref:Uncharacterized protein n=1 Tax=Metarhizium rileyi (strain RCEF 4871) TaxID=1649241 RepID=A0A166WVK8_METRR|nr:hypothetical protein NOR_08072 [Metarhizium rileyi RCEF 4871]
MRYSMLVLFAAIAVRGSQGHAAFDGELWEEPIRYCVESYVGGLSHHSTLVAVAYETTHRIRKVAFPILPTVATAAAAMFLLETTMSAAEL